MCQPQASAAVSGEKNAEKRGFRLRKKVICATMKLVTKKCVMSKTMRQMPGWVLAHCLRLWKEWVQGGI